LFLPTNRSGPCTQSADSIMTFVATTYLDEEEELHNLKLTTIKVTTSWPRWISTTTRSCTFGRCLTTGRMVPTTEWQTSRRRTCTNERRKRKNKDNKVKYCISSKIFSFERGKWNQWVLHDFQKFLHYLCATKLMKFVEFFAKRNIWEMNRLFGCKERKWENER